MSSRDVSVASDGPSSSETYDQETKLFVGNVPLEICNKTALYHLFMAYGQVKEVYCHPPQPKTSVTWAFVTYFTRRNAQKAILKCHRQPPYFLKVEYSIPKERSNEAKDKFPVESTRYESTRKPQRPTSSRNGPPPLIRARQFETAQSGSSVELFKVEEEPPFNTFVKVVIVHPVRPFEYWVALSSNYDHVMSLSQDLAQFEDLLKFERPSVGGYCIAKHRGSWYRVKILSLEPQISVVFVDLGNVSHVDAKDLRKLPDVGKKLKSQAIFIKMAKGTSESYKSVPEHGELLVKFVEKKGNVFIVHVDGENYEETSPAPFLRDQLPVVDLVEGSCILTAVNEKEVFVRPVTEESFDALEMVQNELMEYCAKSKALHRSPEVGEVLAAKFSDGLFYRAEIIRFTLMGVIVKYIDYGNILKVEEKDLKPLPDSLQIVPCLAVPIEVEEILNMSIEESGNVLKEYIKSETMLKLEKEDSDYESISIYTPHLQIIGIVGGKCALYDQKMLTLRSMEIEVWDVGSEVEIRVFDILDYNSISASLVKSRSCKELDENLQKVIDDYCDEHGPYVPDEEELCLARINERWCRCWCTTKGKIGTVTLMETGESYPVPYKHVRKMPEMFTTLPMAGAKCTLLLKDGLSKRDKFAVIGFLSLNKKVTATVVSSYNFGYCIKIHEIDDLLRD